MLVSAPGCGTHAPEPRAETSAPAVSKPHTVGKSVYGTWTGKAYPLGDVADFTPKDVSFEFTKDGKYRKRGTHDETGTFTLAKGSAAITLTDAGGQPTRPGSLFSELFKPQPIEWITSDHIKFKSRFSEYDLVRNLQ